MQLPKRVLEDRLLQDEFSEPVVLDTRVFQLLNYGLEKIYNRVDEEEPSPDMRHWKSDKISHLEAEKLQMELHAKFRGGQILDNANFLEQSQGPIKDIFDQK